MVRAIQTIRKIWASDSVELLVATGCFLAVVVACQRLELSGELLGAAITFLGVIARYVMARPKQPADVDAEPARSDRDTARPPE